MTSRLDALAGRIRSEYKEMPGLQLTFEQACRLWQLDPISCHAVLQVLLEEGFLERTARGSFIVRSLQSIRGSRHESTLN